MLFKRIFLLTVTILIIQIVTVNSQTYSVNPITTSSIPSPTNPPISLTKHIIQVGYMGVGFSRNNFTVGKGDALFWEWLGNAEHSVVESTLEYPCKRKEGGFDLGIHTEPYNVTMLAEDRTYVFYSNVSDDCIKGMYGGINLPQGYNWPNDLTKPPEQVYTTPLNPTPTPTPTPTSPNFAPTGSMTIQAADAEGPNANSTKLSSSNLKEPGYGVIIGILILTNLYLIL